MKKILGLMVGILLTGANLYAGNGDLIVNGNLGVGITGPYSKFHIQGSSWNGITLTTSDNVNTIGTLKYDPAGTYATGKRFLLLSDESTNLDGSNGGIMFRVNNGPTGGYTSLAMVIRENGKVGIGTTDPGSYKLYVSGPAYSTSSWQSSDIKFKKDIVPIDSSLDKILKLSGVSYEFKTDEFKEKNFSGGRHYGVIAQEIEKVLPEVVKEDTDGSKAVAYTEIIPVLIEAMKEQQKQISDQQKRIEELEKKVALLK